MNRNQYELYHYGVKGMKWGVRRYQDKNDRLTSAGKKHVSNKEIRSTHKQVYEKNLKRLRKEYGIEEKITQAVAYGKKHKLDLDDGGGNPKYGSKYMSMWEEIYKMEDRAGMNAGKITAKHMIDTYGEKKMKSIERIDNAKSTAFVAAFLGAPFVLAGGIIVSDLRS